MMIYDLEKRATPGPLEIVCCTGGDGVRLREGMLCFDRDSPDAKLLAHCRNNFMEALEMLHRVVFVAEADGTMYLLPCGIEALIAKLEDVE